MNTLRTLTLGSLLSAALAVSSSAQVFEVPGDYASIQAALDDVPDGAVIVVHGGTWDTITIRKPVSLVGAPAPFLAGAASGGISAIILDGTGAGEVTLSRIRTGTIVPDFSAPVQLAPAIQGGGFEELHVYDSEILNNERSGFSGLGYGSSAVATDVPFVLIERSRVKGSRTDIDDACTGNPESWIPDAGIFAPDSTVVVLDSEITGGDMGVFQYSGWFGPGSCDAPNCPPFPGALGVECDTLYHSGSTIAGGRGARWFTCSPRTYCCESPPGAPFSAALENPLDAELTADGPVMLGRTTMLHLASPGPTADLLLAFDLTPPVFISGQGERFLETATTQSLGMIPTPGDYPLAMPLDAALIGREIVLQLLDATSGYSRPVASVLLPARLRSADTPSRTVTRGL